MRHLNVDEDLFSSSPGEGSDVMTSDELEYEMDGASDDEETVILDGVADPDLAIPEPAARYSSDDEDTGEFCPSLHPEEIGINKRDAGGNLIVGRKFGSSASSYQPTLTLSGRKHKVSSAFGGYRNTCRTHAVHNTFVNHCMCATRNRRQNRR